MSGVASLYRSVRSGVAPAAKSLLFRSGALAALRRVKPSRQLAILRYHAICGPQGHAYASPGICVSPAAFEDHVRYLSANYRVVSLPEAVPSLRGGRPLPPNAVAITFDDGYADNLAAARTLARYGLTATFYIAAGCLDGGEPFWPSELRYLLAGCDSTKLRLEASGVGVDLDLASEGGRAAALSTLTKTFKAHPIPVRDALRAQLRRLSRTRSLPRVMLTWDELREMHRLGMTIGAHTVTHPNLPNAGLEAATREINQSKAMLEERLGATVTMFSYPNGGAERYMTPEVARLVREAGFEAATTSRNAFAGAKSDLFALERVQVTEGLQDLVFALEIERFAFKPSARPGEVE
jgi:peptidoglycan/xylan/chitin deacetylase (PgdA/CDA1 family)